MADPRPHDTAGSATTPPARPPHAPRRTPRLGMVLAAATGALALSAAGAFVAFDRLYGGRVLPSVSIAGTSVAGLGHSEAEQALKAHHADFLATPARITYGDTTWLPSLEQLGVTVQVHNAVVEALSAGRQPNPFSAAPEAMLIVREGLNLPLRVAVDEQQLRAYLESLADEVDHAPTDATIRVVGGRVETTPAREGRRLTIEPAVVALRVPRRGSKPGC